MFNFVPFAAGIIENPALELKATRLGLIIGTAGTISKHNWESAYAIAGRTYPVKDTLKANGARWDGAAKAWSFTSMESLAVAINAIEEAN